MITVKTYKFRLKPTKSQAQKMYEQACAQRWVWNWALNDRNTQYKETGKSPSAFDQGKSIVKLKKEEDTAWLNQYFSHSYLQTLADLDKSFKAFFNKTARYPKFKSKRNETRSFGQLENVSIKDGKINVPKVGKMKLYGFREIEGKTKGARYKQDSLGHWYVSITVEQKLTEGPMPLPSRGVGIDLGLESFIATSDGEKVSSPKFFRKSEKKLARAQRSLSRKQKGSKNREKQKRKVAKIHKKVSNQRQDFLHKLSTQIVKDHDLISVEDLNIKGMAKTKLAKSISDASWSEFVIQLEYKSLWNRKHFVKIDRWYPSSKTCSSCGVVKDTIPLNIRSWVCQCGELHDRDINAAKNILQVGNNAVGQTVNACGDVVNLST